MTTDQDAEQQQDVPRRKKMSSEEVNRRKKFVPGSLMKAEIRPPIEIRLYITAQFERLIGFNQLVSQSRRCINILWSFVLDSMNSMNLLPISFVPTGKGISFSQVLGKSMMILGYLEGFPTMSKGEVAKFKMKADMHYGETDCPVSVAESFPKDDEIHFKIETIDFFKVKVISNDDMGVIKKVLDDGQGWESPREPYELKAW